MNDNFEVALKASLDSELSWTEDFDNPLKDYEFSEPFENKMKKVIGMSEYTYVSVGRNRIRKGLAVILVALLSLMIAGCAVAVHKYIEWNETQNDAQGTLDITFGAVDPNTAKTEMFLPKVPDEYRITSEDIFNNDCTVEYESQEGVQLLFYRAEDIESMGLSIDSEADNFAETTIRGWKGYSSYDNGLSVVYWADSKFYYMMEGTCSLEALMSMIEY